MNGGVWLAGIAIVIAGCQPATNANGDVAGVTTPAPEDEPMPLASRLPPLQVPPVTIGGIEFRQLLGPDDASDASRGGYLGAFAADGSPLWTLQVYASPRRPDLEGDVQDVYFTAIVAEANGQLLIENEAGARFRVDVTTRTVVPVARAAVPATPGSGLRPDQ